MSTPHIEPPVPPQFQGFTHDELLWIVTALARARSTCARDDPTLIALFETAVEALKDSHS